ncbi:hypothetical protein MO867_22820, partial [Microbulbifer sp. OS29]
MTKQIYKVLQPVKVAGKIVKAGTVSCAPEEAKPLLKSDSLIAAGTSAGDGEISMEVFAEAVAQ